MHIPSALIIDDNESDRYLLKRELLSIDFTGFIFEQSNGKDALDFLMNYDGQKKHHGDKFPPTIIFLDINMPLMNGFEFLEHFHALKADSDKYESVILMMFTSSENVDDINKALSYKDVKKYLIKGEYDLDEFKDSIFEICCDEDNPDQ